VRNRQTLIVSGRRTKNLFINNFEQCEIFAASITSGGTSEFFVVTSSRAERKKMLEWLGDLFGLLWGAVVLVLSVDFLSDLLLLSVLYVVGRYVYVAFRTPPPGLRSS
jgi:hypothetical protein